MVKNYDPKKYGQLPDKTYDTLNLEEVVCQVCKRLAYPPVTLTCDHLLCNECYESIKEEGKLRCPVCRKRFDHFDRRRKSKVINVNLQEAILRFFPEKVELKINGQDDGIEEELRERDVAASRVISMPGEVNKEYLLAVEQDNREREQEQLASEKCAEEIQKQEEKIANELKRLEEEDARVAQSILQQEEEEYRQINQEKERLEKLDKQLALDLLKEQGGGGGRVLTPRIAQRRLDSYVATEGSTKSNTAPSSGPASEESVLGPNSSFKTEQEVWFEEAYLEAQIESDRMVALRIQKELEMEIKNNEKKRVSEYSLRSSSKKKKPGKHSSSPRKQIKLDSMFNFIPRKLSY